MLRIKRISLRLVLDTWARIARTSFLLFGWVSASTISKLQTWSVATSAPDAVSNTTWDAAGGPVRPWTIISFTCCTKQDVKTMLSYLNTTKMHVIHFLARDSDLGHVRLGSSGLGGLIHLRRGWDEMRWDVRLRSGWGSHKNPHVLSRARVKLIRTLP